MEDDAISSMLIIVPILLFLLLVTITGLTSTETRTDQLAVILLAILSVTIGIAGTGTLLSKIPN